MFRVILIHVFLLLSYILITFSASAGIDDGLIAYYPLDGNESDESGNGHHGVPSDAPLDYTSGVIGSAVVLDGIDDWIIVDTSLDFPTDHLTISAWVYVDEGSAVPPGLVELATNSSDVARLRYGHNIDSFGFRIVSPYTVVEAPGSVNQWHHVAGVYDRSTYSQKIYLDGELINENNTIATFPNITKLYIGRRQVAGRQLEGMIDEVRIYDRALSSIEIEELSSQESKYPVPSGPIAYFPFDGLHNDDAENTHPTAHGEIAYIKGIKDQALELDGNSENYISAVPLPSVGDTFNFSSDKISISAWAYITGGHVAPRIVELADSSGDICRLWHQGDSIHFGLVSTGDVLSYEVEGLEWVHMVGVYDETAQKMKLYIDGKKVKEQTVDSFIPDVTKIFIGNAYDGTRSFNGYIDEVYIYNRVLSQSEISKLANLCPFHYEFVSETGNALVSSTQCSFDDINRWQFKKSMKSLIIDGSIDISLELIKSLAEKYNTYLLPTSIITTLSTWKNEVYNPVMIVPVGEFDVYRPLIENSDYSVYICPTDDTTAIVLLDFMKNSDYFDQINYQWISLELAWGSTVIGTTGEEDLLTADEIKNLDKTKNYIVFPDVYADTSIDSDHPKVVEMRGFLWRDTPTGDNFYRSTVTITDNNSMCEDEVLMSIPTIY